MTPDELLDRIINDAPEELYVAFRYSAEDPKEYFEERGGDQIIRYWDISKSFVNRYCGLRRETAVDALRDFFSDNYDCVARLNDCGEFETVLDPWVLA